MLRGYRGIVAALGLVLAAHHPNAEAQPKQSNPQERSASALENIASRYGEQAKRSESSRETEQCEQRDDKRYSDLCAQWKAADAAADSAWWAAVGGFATAISTVLVLIALRLAFGSNSIARDTAKRQLRAYLTFGEFVLNLDKADWRLQLKWNNRGQTPAIEVHTVADWIALETPLPADFIFPDPPPFEEDGPATIGPNQSVYGTCPQDLSPALLMSVANGDRQMYVWGSVEYLDAFGQLRRSEIAAKVHVQSLPGGSTVTRWRTLDRHNGIDDGCMKPHRNANDDKHPRADG